MCAAYRLLAVLTCCWNTCSHQCQLCRVRGSGRFQRHLSVSVSICGQESFVTQASVIQSSPVSACVTVNVYLYMRPTASRSKAQNLCHACVSNSTAIRSCSAVEKMTQHTRNLENEIKYSTCYLLLSLLHVFDIRPSSSIH